MYSSRTSFVISGLRSVLPISVSSQEITHHGFSPVGFMISTLIIVLYQDSLPITESIIVINTGFTCFIFRHLLVPFLSAHIVHIGITPDFAMLLSNGDSQHSVPHSGHVVSLHPSCPSGTFFFNGIQAYPPLSFFFLGHIFIFMFLLLINSSYRMSQ